LTAISVLLIKMQSWFDCRYALLLQRLPLTRHVKQGDAHHHKYGHDD
jgi:hypothetical protein